MNSSASNDFDIPPDRALLVVDMKGYSQLPESKMAPIRSDLDDILDTVFAQCGLDFPHSRADTYKDTGDGAIIVLPTRDTARLVDPLLGMLEAALDRYDKTRLSSGPPIRLRASLHTGPLSLPDHRGDAINDVNHLVNSQAVRDAMTAALQQGHFLAAVLSEQVFRRTVQAGRTPALAEEHFLAAAARVADKTGFDEPCRLHVPGMSAAELRPYIRDLPPTPAADPPPAAASAAAPMPTGGGPTFLFNAPLHDPTIAGEIGTLRIDRSQR